MAGVMAAMTTRVLMMMRAGKVIDEARVGVVGIGRVNQPGLLEPQVEHVRAEATEVVMAAEAMVEVMVLVTRCGKPFRVVRE